VHVRCPPVVTRRRRVGDATGSYGSLVDRIITPLRGAEGRRDSRHPLCEDDLETLLDLLYRAVHGAGSPNARHAALFADVERPLEVSLNLGMVDLTEQAEIASEITRAGPDGAHPVRRVEDALQVLVSEPALDDRDHQQLALGVQWPDIRLPR